MELGQYFTKSNILKNNVIRFIRNNPKRVLEPSFGAGHLIKALIKKYKYIKIDGYEIDDKIQSILEESNQINLVYEDFLKADIKIKYKTIFGNPPFVKLKHGNLYLDFINKCVDLLNDDGELIFIVPSDFIKLTSSKKIIEKMLNLGSFTDIYFANDESLFDGASIDIIIFRYQKDIHTNIVMINEEEKYINNHDGIITFSDEKENGILLKDLFVVYVGLVTGKESVFKSKLGNIKILNDENIIKKYICIEKFPCENDNINEYLIQHKDELIKRKIRKFTEKNWFEFGAPRNKTKMEKYAGKKCIYMRNITRKSEVAFKSEVMYFGGKLIILIPKKNIKLNKIIKYFNSDEFKHNYTYSGRFKIGHRQLENVIIPMKIL